MANGDFWCGLPKKNEDLDYMKRLISVETPPISLYSAFALYCFFSFCRTVGLLATPLRDPPDFAASPEIGRQSGVRDVVSVLVGATQQVFWLFSDYLKRRIRERE